MKVRNLINKKGNVVKNQFVIEDGNTDTFQSYETPICSIHFGSAFIRMSSNALDYSRTTNRYLCQFLSDEFYNGYKKVDTKTIKAWIKDGKTERLEGLAGFMIEFDVQIVDSLNEF